jgi:hypothetical protein
MGAPIGNKYALGNRGGRPTKYNETVLETARDYFNGGYEQFGVLPTIERLALVLGVGSDTVQAWEKQEDKNEFSIIVKGIRNLQADLLLNKCLLNEWNSRTGNLLLSKHGYAEKKELSVDAPKSVKIDIHFEDGGVE